MIDDMISCYRC